MAKTRSARRRRRKHRGTQAGTIETPARDAGRRTRASAKGSSAAARRQERHSRPPTWRGAIARAGIAAVLFGAITIALLGRTVAQGAALAAVAWALYVPTGYLIDRALYQRRQSRFQASTPDRK